MIYIGSKRRIAKHILPFIQRELTSSCHYVEPFCGGMNMMQHVSHPHRIANDSNKYLIAMWKAVLQRRWMGPYVTQEEYIAIRKNKDNYPDCTVGWVGFLASFRGKFFGGYSKKYVHVRTGRRDGQQEHIDGIKKQIPFLKDIQLECKSYLELIIPPNSVIYCDPPYKNTMKYVRDFDHDQFWEWCRTKHKEGHKIFISEYEAPDDFTCVWSGNIKNEVAHNKQGKSSKYVQERLFTLR